MAAGVANLTNLANAVAELYEKPFGKLKDQDKRSFLARIPKKRNKKATIDWKVRDAEYSPVWSASEADQALFLAGPPAGGVGPVATDGVGSATAFLAPNNHPFLNASVSIRINYAAVSVSGLAEAALTGGDASYVNVVSDETEQAMNDFWRSLNIDALSTATTSGNSGKDIDGLGVMFNATSYAGLAVASYPEWLPVRDTTTTVMSIAALQTMWNNIEGGTETLGAETIRDGDVKEIWTSPAQFTAYGNLLTPQRRYTSSETLDGGIGEGLEFNGVPVMMIRRFPAGYLVMYTGGMEYRVLKELGTSDKSDAYVDQRFLVLGHYSNLVLKERKNQGIFTALT